jgi:hypothetical protein
MQKESSIINRNTLLYVSTLPGHLQGEEAGTSLQRVHASKNNAVHSQQHILT